MVESVEEKKSIKEKKPKYRHYCLNNHNKPFKLEEQQFNLKYSICNTELVAEELLPETK